jgi:hypothetical protein
LPSTAPMLGRLHPGHGQHCSRHAHRQCTQDYAWRDRTPDTPTAKAKRRRAARAADNRRIRCQVKNWR